MRVVAAVTKTEFQRVVRDRAALFFIIVLPVAIILIVGAVFGEVPRHAPVGVVDNDRSETSGRFVEALVDTATLDVSIYSDEGDLRRDIRNRHLVAGVSFPAGFGASVSEGADSRVSVLTQAASGTEQLVEPAVRDVVTRMAARDAAARFATDLAGGSRSDNRELADRLALSQRPVDLEVETVGEKSTSSFVGADGRYSYTAPANLVLFVFINSVTAGAALVESRRLGVTRRMLVAPVSPSAIVAGFGANRFLFAMLQSVLIVVVGELMFGVSWGTPGAAVVLIIIWAAVGTGAGLLIGSVARTPEQVTAVGVPVSIALAMAGGSMWPLEIVSPTMRSLGHLTPHAWANDAWVKLVFEHGGLGSIMGNLAVLVGFAAVLLALATWRLRRVLTS